MSDTIVVNWQALQHILFNYNVGSCDMQKLFNVPTLKRKREQSTTQHELPVYTPRDQPTYTPRDQPTYTSSDQPTYTSHDQPIQHNKTIEYLVKHVRPMKFNDRMFDVLNKYKNCECQVADFMNCGTFLYQFSKFLNIMDVSMTYIPGDIYKIICDLQSYTKNMLSYSFGKFKVPSLYTYKRLKCVYYPACDSRNCPYEHSDKLSWYKLDECNSMPHGTIIETLIKNVPHLLRVIGRNDEIICNKFAL